MTPEQIALVERSFEAVKPIAPAAAALFYDRLFALDPALRSLFKGDMAAQGQKLMQSIAMVVQGLRAPESIMPAVTALGRRHRDYGVKPEHYGTVGTALLWTLEQGLGDAFTPAVREAWGAAYKVLADTMIAAAEAGAPA